MSWQRLLLTFVIVAIAGHFSWNEANAEDVEPTGEHAADVSFARDIQPIFQANCQGCHQPAKRGGEYVMTSYESLLAGGESETAAIIPGKPDDSELLIQIVAKDGKAAMPKGKSPLAEAEVALIRKWIEQGAKDDTPDSGRVQYDAEHPPIYEAAPVITSIDYSPNDELLAIAGYHEVLLHRADGSELVGRLIGVSERIEEVAFSPDGKQLAVAGGNPGRMGEVQIWDVEKQKLQLAISVGYDTLYGTSWSPDGKLVAFGCPDNTFRAIEAATGKEVLFNGAHSDWVLDTVFSVKGDHLVTVSRDRSMKLTNVPTQRFIDNITSITPGALSGGIHAVDRHPTKDELLVGGSDGVAKTYKMFRDKARKIGDDFNRLKSFPEMPGRIFAVTYNHDGTHVAAGTSYNGSGEARVFETASAKEIAKFEISAGGVYTVAFDTAGKHLAVAGFDGIVRLFDIEKKALLKEFAPAPIAETPQ